MLELQMHEAKMLKQQGKKVTQIAQALGKSERMIHYYLCEPTRSRKKRTYTSKLDPYKPYIDTILEEDPSFNREVLLNRLQQQGYDGKISILRDYAAARASEISRKAIIRFETEPAFQAQVDWKVLNTQMVDGKEQKLYAFVMVLGYSRKPFIMHTTSMDQATVLMCHVLAFTYFGGIPYEILYDNMRTAFVYSTTEERWKPNKHLLSLARHYGFTPMRCQVRRPQTKGKVERFIQYYDRNFWIEHKGKALSLQMLNESVQTWIDKISSWTIQGLNESRADRFSREQRMLLPLPERHMDCRKKLPVVISGESLARIENNWYSVPVKFIGESLSAFIDPLSGVCEIVASGMVVRTFVVDREKRNHRFYLAKHKKELLELWLKQREGTKPRRKRIECEVDTRSPQLYERLFSSQEVAS